MTIKVPTRFLLDRRACFIPSKTGPWDHLKRPFRTGKVIPSNRHPTEFHFTFFDADGAEYHNRFSDLPGDVAHRVMLEFVCKANGTIV
jgi:hypothetical protein